MSEPYELPDERPFDAGDVEHVRARKLTAKERQRDIDSFLVAVMSTMQGRMWIWDLLTRSRMFQSSFDNKALTMAFNEGQRNLGLQLITEIMRVAPEQWIKMSRENGETNV